MKKHYTFYCLLCFFTVSCSSSDDSFCPSQEEDYNYDSGGLSSGMKHLVVNEDDTIGYEQADDARSYNDSDPENEQALLEQALDQIDEQEDIADSLCEAIQCSDLKIIKRCLKNIDDDHLLASSSSWEGERTLLHEAAEQEGISVFKTVFEMGYCGREINVQEEIAKEDMYGSTVLSIAIKNNNWKLCNYLHNYLDLTDTLRQLYKSLSNDNTHATLIENLLSDDGIHFLPYLFTYNYDLAESIADDNNWEDPLLCAKFYYLLSQWEEEEGGDISKLIATDGYMDKAINLANEDPGEQKLYMAYKATLLLALGQYHNAEELACSAAAIQANTVMADLFICYVKTICALQKKEYKQYATYYDQMIKSFRHIPHNEQSVVKNKLIACFGELETQTNRRETVNATTVASSVKQGGKVSKLFGEHNVVKRPYRTFSDQERLLQLLKQLATQLYFSATRHKIKLTELQIMYCQINGKTKLFIAANELEDATRFFEILHELKSSELVQLFTSVYNPSGDPEGRIRSKRYSKKLGKLFHNDLNERFASSKKPDSILFDFNTNKELYTELKYIENVLTILRESRPQLLPLTYEKGTIGICLNKPSQELVEKAIASTECQLYFITGQCTPYSGRHAEEFLCDIFEFAKSSRCYGSYWSCIAGKKRPCIGCSGRMETARISKFNPRPGKIWLDPIKYQPSDVAKRSIEILFEKPNHISLTKDKKESPGYDSGSESDFSDEEGKNGNRNPNISGTKKERDSGTGKKNNHPSAENNTPTSKKPASKNNQPQQTTNVICNGKSISSIYWYEDKDMQTILTIEVNARQNKTIHGKPIYILGPLDNVSAYSLKHVLDDHQRKEGIVLIPFNLGLSHWVGLILKYTSSGKLVQADYYDPLGGSVPVYFNRILRAHNQNRYDEELIAFTRIRDSQLVRQKNVHDCGPCTIANLLKNAGIGYHEDSNISPIVRRFNHLQLLENSGPNFYNDFYTRQQNNRHSFGDNQAVISFLTKCKGVKGSPQLTWKEYEALFEIAISISAIEELASRFKEIVTQAPNANWDSQEHQVSLAKVRSLLTTRNFFTLEEQKAMDTIAKRIFYLDTSSSIDMAPLRIEYDHLLLLVKMLYSLKT